MADDGTFKSRDELEAIDIGEKGIGMSKPTIAYCRIGARSSHTWFALKYLLGHGDVRNYDGSWTEYGNLFNPHIARVSYCEAAWHHSSGTCRSRGRACAST